MNTDPENTPAYEAVVKKMRKTMDTLKTNENLVVELTKKLEITSDKDEKVQLRKALGSANRKVSSSLKYLNKEAHLNPEAAKEVGYTPTAIRTLVRVYEYGALHSPVMEDKTHHEQDGSMNIFSRQMRLRHEYWNQLVAAFEPYKTKILALAGTTELEYREISRQIQEIYHNLGQLRSEHALSGAEGDPRDSEAYRSIKATIPELDKTRKALIPKVGKERKESKYIETASIILKEMSETKNEICRKLANLPDGGLFWHNSDTIYSSFKTATEAFVKKLDIYKYSLHFKYENTQGEAPSDMLTYERWDGVGTVSIRTKKDISQDVVSVMNGTNTLFQLRPFTESDLASFPKLKVNLSLPSSKRIYLAKIRVQSEGQSPIWAIMPIILHRSLPLPEKADTAKKPDIVCVTDATFTVRKDSVKVGKKRKFKLTVGVKFPYKIETPGEAAATITLTNDNPKGPFGSFERQDDSVFKVFQAKSGYTWVEGNTLMPNQRILSATKRREDNLIPAMEQSDREIKNYINAGLTEQGRRLPGFFKESGISLYKVNKHGHSIITVPAVVFAFKQWRRKLIAEAGSDAQAVGITNQLKIMRELAVTRYQELKTGSEVVSSNFIVQAHQLAWDYGVEEMGLSNNDAWLLAYLTFFVARHEHLARWVDGIERKARGQRKHEYRVFAHHFLKGVNILTLKMGNFKTRAITEEQKTFSKSDFEAILRSAAEKAGVVIKDEVIKTEKKSKIKVS